MASDTKSSRVVSIVALDGFDDAAVLALAAAAAPDIDAASAAAILDSARDRGITPAAARRTIVVGARSLFDKLRIAMENVGDWPERLERRGQRVLLVATDGRAAGVLGMEDEMRESVPAADFFPTATSGLPSAIVPEVIELVDGGEFHLRVSPVTKRLADAAVRMLAYNGSIPGPTLRVRQGSNVLIHVTNDGDLDTTVHWHGLRLNNSYDGTTLTQSPIPTGGRFTYRLTFPDPGVYWYHPHIREDYAQEMGLYGNIIVLPTAADYWPPANRDIALTLDDLLVEDSRMAPFRRSHPTFTAMGRFGNVLLVNGEPAASLRAEQGEVVRLYLTNTANTRVFNVAIPGARLKLVGGDSGRCEHEQLVDGVVIAPSERAVVDVLFDEAGEFRLEHRTPDRTYVLAAIKVTATQVMPPLAAAFAVLRTSQDLTDTRARIEQYLHAEPDKTLALVAEMNMGDASPAANEGAYVCPMHPDVTSGRPDRCQRCGMKLVPAELVGANEHAAHTHATTDAQAHGEVNMPAGIEWEDDMVGINRMTTPTNMRWKLIDRATGAEGHAIEWRFRVGQMVKIRLVNEMDSDHPMHHPFHVHGAGRFLVLSRDGNVEDNLMWKDTVLVRTGETVDILLELTNAGVWMAHCHIAEHHESGMMLTFSVDL